MEISENSNDIDKSLKSCENDKYDFVSEQIENKFTPELPTDDQLHTICITDDVNYQDDTKKNNIDEHAPYFNSGDVIPDPYVGKKYNENESIVTSTSLHNLSTAGTRRNTAKGNNIPAVKGTRGYRCPYRVTFLENIVSDYLEPSNPWEKAIEHTTEDLVLAYIKSCEAYSLKIIPLLFQQLKAINDFTKRNETFTLKGEKLHYRNVETIEEVLKRVQFRTIDVENTHLDAETAVILFEIIEFYHSCIRLNLSNNKSLGIRGWQALSRLIKKMPSLRQLDIRACSITEQIMPIFCRSLRLSQYLKILHLENSVYSGRHIMILVAALKMNTILEELYLSDNKLMSSDGIHFGAMFKFNNSIRVFDLRNNHLQVNTNSIETLNISNNNISNEGIFLIKDALLANKSILHFDLQSTRITCQGAISLAEFLAEPSNMLRLDLRDNNILTGGLMALSLGFKTNLQLRRLDLDKRPKKEQGIKDYTEQQSRLLFEMAKYTKRNLELSWSQDKVIGSTISKSPEHQVEALSSSSSSNSVNSLNNHLQKINNVKDNKYPIKEDDDNDDDDMDGQFIASPIQAKSLLTPIDPQDKNENHQKKPKSITSSSVLQQITLTIDSSKLKINKSKTVSPQVSPNSRFHISKVIEDKKYSKTTSRKEISHSTTKEDVLCDQIIAITLNQQLNDDAISGDQSTDSNINDISIVIEDENC